MKIITICGSIKFKDEMIKTALQMELNGNVVLTPIFPPDNSEIAFTDREIAVLGEMHKEKIKLSDAVLVMNKDGYIGSSTKGEIEFAKALNKEIMYYTDLKAANILQ